MIYEVCAFTPRNDLANELNQHGLGIHVGNVNFSILMFADDIVLMSENEHNLQRMLNIVYDWCHKWRLSVNRDKTKIVHFRKCRKEEPSMTLNLVIIPWI